MLFLQGDALKMLHTPLTQSQTLRLNKIAIEITVVYHNITVKHNEWYLIVILTTAIQEFFFLKKVQYLDLFTKTRIMDSLGPRATLLALSARRYIGYLRL